MKTKSEKPATPTTQPAQLAQTIESCPVRGDASKQAASLPDACPVRGDNKKSDGYKNPNVYNVRCILTIEKVDAAALT